MAVIRTSFFGPDGFAPEAPEGVERIDFQELKAWVKSGRVFGRLFRYAEVEMYTYRLAYVPKPFLAALLLRLLSRGTCRILDETGTERRITLPYLLEEGLRFLRDLLRGPALVRRVRREVARLAREAAEAPPPCGALDFSGRPVYLRADLWLGIKSGGSVGHVAGVLNRLDAFGGKPVFLTPDPVPTVRADLELHLVPPASDFCGMGPLPAFFYNRTLLEKARRILSGSKISFLYHRYSLNHYAAAALARQLRVPFVLEYNGSEVWINRHWGKPLRHEDVSLAIEDLVLRAADVVVVVSRPMREELERRGIDPAKILVNPNGVDPDRYSPSVDGKPVRRRLGLEGKKVIGFIGTFGAWHGAEILVEAFGRLLARRPDLRHNARLLLVGDGVRMPEVKRRIAQAEIGDACVLTGLVPQEEGPAHLAACDVLAASHVPNPDGTPFFGSPTKLFEYMASAKGIVASDLDQIGEVLEHGRTAWLVPPGDAEALSRGIEKLLDEPELARRLGDAARKDAVAKHTWEVHVRRIVEKIRERCG